MKWRFCWNQFFAEDDEVVLPSQLLEVSIIMRRRVDGI